MKKGLNNYAFIDGANLHHGVQSLDWKPDYKRFRILLQEKYSVLVSSDGDYASLVKFLDGKNKFECILSPYETSKCSILLKRIGVKISYLSDQKNILEKDERKSP